MATIIQNPFFQVIVLFFVSSAVWYFLTTTKRPVKRKAFDVVTDAAYYFIFSILGLNLLLNFKAVLQQPYRILVFSSTVSFLAALLALGLLFYKYHESIPKNKDVMDSILDDLLILGLLNHLFYYYKYQDILSVVLVVTYFLVYFFKMKWTHPYKVEYLLLVLALVHGLFLYGFGRVVIYYQIVFYPYQIVSLFLLIGVLLRWLRRDIHRN